jgi:hypothetical protein
LPVALRVEHVQAAPPTVLFLLQGEGLRV